jgi:hypothetical protein
MATDQGAIRGKHLDFYLDGFPFGLKSGVIEKLQQVLLRPRAASGNGRAHAPGTGAFTLRHDPGDNQ